MILTESERKFKKFHVGQRVLYSGRTSYNYPGDGKLNGVSKQLGTITIIGNSITIELDKYRKPYFTESSLPELDHIYTIPVKQYATVNIGDLVCGEKKVEPLYSE